MLSIMSWNLANLARPEPGADEGELRRASAKLERIGQIIDDSRADLVGVQEVLADPLESAPPVFADLLTALGPAWVGVLSRSPDGRGIRVGWLARGGTLNDPVDVAAFPARVPPVTVDDAGTTITRARRGGLAVRYTRADGLYLDALCLHLKSKLLSYPGNSPDQPRFDTRDEAERARFGVYAVHQRAAEAATARAWATARLEGQGRQRLVVVLGDLNDTPQSATTRILLGRDGSQLGTGGFDHPDWGDGNRLFNLAPAMPAGDPDRGVPAANWSRMNNGVPELIDQVLVSHRLVHALDSTESLPLDDTPDVTADPDSLADMAAPSDHRPVVARFTL